MTRAELILDISAKVLTGGRRTTAANLRSLHTIFANFYVHKDDDRNVDNGYMPVEQTLTSGRIPFYNLVGLTDSFLKQPSVAGITLDDGKYFMGSDGLSQIDFGSAGSNYVWASVDGQTGAQSFLYLTPSYCQYGFAGNYIQSETSNGINHFADAGLAHKFSVDGTEKVEINDNGLNIGYATPDTVGYIDSANTFVSSAVTPTELGFVAGVTSPIQSQLNAITSGLTWKETARVASFVNINIAVAPANIDGIAMTVGDRVLLAGQTSAPTNGVYVYNGTGSAMTRSLDTDNGVSILGMVIAIEEGTFADKGYINTTNAPINLGVTNIVYAVFGGTTYIGTANRVTVTGNIIDISAAYVGQASITTLGTITTGTWTTTTTLTGNAFVAQGTAGAGFMQLNSQSANVAAGPTNSVRVWSRGGHFAYTQENDGFYRLFLSTVTGNRIYGWPDTDGVFAQTVTAAKGDIIARSATVDVALNVGLNTQRIIADSSQATGLRWGDTFSSILTPAAFAATQNNYNPAGLADANVLRLNPTGNQSITGITAPAAAKTIYVLNISTANLVISDADAGSTAANRFAVNSSFTLNQNEGATFWYDTILTRWVCMGRHN